MIRTLLRLVATVSVCASLSGFAQVPVPQPTFTSGQLYQPLRTFTAAEIGLRSTYAAMHKGYLVISGGRSGADPTGYGRLTTWRLSQAASPTVLNPSIIGNLAMDSLFKTHNMGFSGDMTQVRRSRYTIVNLADMAAPVITGTDQPIGAGDGHSTCWAGKYMFVAGEGYSTASGGMHVVDVSNPAVPVLKKLLDIPTITGFRCASTYALGNLLVVTANQTNGIATFDISNPENPQLISVFRNDTTASTYTSYLSGHRLYGGGQGGGLFIYDVQNPENIQLVDTVTSLGGTPRYPVVKDEFVHIANLGNGRYQKVKIDVVPAQVVANSMMPIPAGATRADVEIAIPIGNMAFVGTSNADPARDAGWLIPHEMDPDTRAPAVNAVRPLDGETQVALTSMIGVSFTELLDTPSINTGTVIVRPFGGNAITGTYSNQNGIVNFSPTSPLVANTTYEIVVTAGGVKDTQGNATNVERVFRFSTGASVDTTGAGLTLHYPLNETTGTVADDIIGTNDGTLTNFPATPWTQGLIGRSALAFDGTNDYIATPSLDVGTQFSFSTWVRVNSGSTGYHTIVSNSAGGFSTAGFRFFVFGSANATNPSRIQFETGNGVAGNAAVTNTGVMLYDQWVHLGLTVNRTTGTARIYLNGIDKTSDTSVRTDFATAGVMNVGRTGTSGLYLAGHLDDFRLYNRVLNSGDLDQLRLLCENPVQHWRFNSSTATSAPNGSEVTLSASGATYNTTDSQEGAAALDLNGAGYATAPNSDLGNAFTIATWLKVTSGTNTLETIAANSNNGTDTAGWRFIATGSTHTTPGRLILESGNGTVGSGIKIQTANNAITYNTWHHVVAMLDKTRGLSRIYVNGVDQTPSGTARSDFTTNGVLQIGRTADNANLLNGSLDDLRIHPRWLGESEIRVLAVGKLLAHWRFDSTGADESGFGRTATLVNGAGYSTERARGTESLNLDGVANGLDDHATAAALDLGNQFSLSLWARCTSTATGSRTLMANTAAGYSSNGFRFFINSWGTADGRIQLETGNGTIGDAAYTATGVFQFNQWNHIALVVNRSTGSVSIYCNRRLVTADTTIRNDFATNLALYIGRLVSNANFHGQLDDVRIFSKLLTSADIAALGEGCPNTQPSVSTLASSSRAQTFNVDANADGIMDGASVTLTATASDPNVGTELFYRFDFGNGVTTSWTTNPSVTHNYTAPGRYVVTVFVSDGIDTVSTTMTQIIYNAPTALPPSISSEIAYDTTRNKVWVVLPDGDDHDNNTGTAVQGTVVRFDATSFSVNNRLTLAANSEPVALAMRPGNAEVWVANKQAGTVSIIDANVPSVLFTLDCGRGSMPVGVCFAPDGTAAFVACEGLEGVLKFDPATRAKTGAVSLSLTEEGVIPRGIACSSNSTRLFVTRFRSPDARGEVREYLPSAINLTTSATPVRTFNINRDTTTVDSASAARGVPNYLSSVIISPDGLRAWVNAKKDNISRGTARDGQPLTHESTVRSLISQLRLTTNTEVTADRIDLDNTGMTVAGCFSPRGDLFFAAAIGNENVAVIDTATRNTLPAISTATAGQLFGFAPSGLCVSPDGTKLYVHNFMERRVRVFNISNLTSGTSTTVTQVGTVILPSVEPLTATVLLGKKLFYNSNDPRLASEGYISCASCHLGGDHDGRVWDITQFGEGLRNTIDLRGHGGMSQGALHWSANFDEVQDFDGQIRGLSGGSGLIVGAVNTPLGIANAGRSADLDALAAYVTSLNVFPVSPFRQSNGTMTAAALAGQAHFTSIGCATCHSGSAFTDSNASTFTRWNVGTISSTSGKRLGNEPIGAENPITALDTATLRAIWSTPPYLHRGQAATLSEIFNTTNAPGTTNHARFRLELNATQQSELIEYLIQLE
jgi:DNA-binding beta-propeller fold protein YncE